VLDPRDPMTWLTYADEAYLATRLLWFTRLWWQAPVMAHRCLELYLKAYLASRGVRIARGTSAWGHRLANLRDTCATQSRDFARRHLARRLDYFDRYFEFMRYPRDLPAPADGSGIWLAFEAVVAPLDELVAYIRPRTKLTRADWKTTYLFQLRSGSLPEHAIQRKALRQQNPYVDTIVCLHTNRVGVHFDKRFHYDRPGC
jgi:hypothetical protein